jgi:hypothetical protein
MATFDWPDPGDAATGDSTGELGEETVAASERLGDQLLAGQTDAQREIAGEIYRRLKAGDSVDDIKILIGDLAYTATVDQRRRDQQWEASR